MGWGRGTEGNMYTGEGRAQDRPNILTQRTVLFAYSLRGSALSVGVRERNKALGGGELPLPRGCVALAVCPASNPASSLVLPNIEHHFLTLLGTLDASEASSTKAGDLSETLSLQEKDPAPLRITCLVVTGE